MSEVFQSKKQIACKHVSRTRSSNISMLSIEIYWVNKRVKVLIINGYCHYGLEMVKIYLSNQLEKLMHV